MSMSDAERAAKRRYKEKNYKNLSVYLSPSEYDTINEFCKMMNISKARFVFWACNHFIGQGILPPESEILAEYTNDSGDSQNDNNGRDD